MRFSRSSVDALLAVAVPVTVIGLSTATATLTGGSGSIVKALLLGGYFLLCVLGQARSAWRSVTTRVSKEVAIAAVLFACFALTFRTPVSEPTPASIIGLFLLASVEEAGFRVVLPAQFEKALLGLQLPAASRVIAVALSQASFALCHFLPGASRFNSFAWTDAVQLFASGILLWLLVDLFCVAIAIGLHASINYDVVAQGRTWSHVSFEACAFVAAGSMVALCIYCARPSPRPRGA